MRNLKIFLLLLSLSLYGCASLCRNTEPAPLRSIENNQKREEMAKTIQEVLPKMTSEQRIEAYTQIKLLTYQLGFGEIFYEKKIKQQKEMFRDSKNISDILRIVDEQVSNNLANKRYIEAQNVLQTALTTLDVKGQNDAINVQ